MSCSCECHDELNIIEPCVNCEERHTDLKIDVAGDGTDYQVSTKAGREKASKLLEKIPESIGDSMLMEEWLKKRGVKPADAAALFVELGE